MTATWYGTRAAVEGEIRARIAVEADAIGQELSAEGLNEAAAAVASRAKRPGALEYRLTDSGGRVVAGDLPAAPARSGWHVFDVNGGRVLALTLLATNGARIVVGQDIQAADALRKQSIETLLGWSALALAIGLIVGVWITRRSLQRFDAIVATVERVAAGALDARVRAVPNANNDIETLGRGIDAMLDRIESLVSVQRRLSADIAHELRTPLTHVRQHLDAARTSSTVGTAHIDAADAAIDQAIRRFDAMLRLAEVEAGTPRARFVRLDLGALVERVADAYRAEIEESGRVLRADCPSGLFVIGDSDLLGQLVANLLENSLVHTDPGTVIDVLVKSMLEGQVWLQVKDDGPGIDPAMVEVLTKPFERSDASTKRRGTGLGLAIVAAIATCHGSNLIIARRANGAQFEIAFTANP
ncbi:MAG: HAMP domain-containing sensor histidine kinase [Sphingomonadales bacterium]